ncbi:HAD family hydrolase [Thaumasiovibrio subtropicus]|uniref:HAD family hydrolase n=1 Tax=Thaumasiovibrio subtropicus TaxID=1891207 RepID=UPI000B35EFC8|nr:HAD-IA family hydrolase [Thaumasiovibrio subtropicus]
MIDALLFDLDGTLLDTAGDLSNAANKVLTARGYPLLTAAQIQAFTSYGARGLFKAGFGADLQQFDPRQLRKEFLHHYASHINDTTCFYPHIENVLTHLNQHKVPWGIMTNKPAFLTDMLLPDYPLLATAKIIVSGDTLEKAKPHPEPLLYCADAMQVDASRVAYIGDIENDMVAARDARMKGVIAGWGYIGADHQPQSWPHWRYLKQPDELLSLLD